MNLFDTFAFDELIFDVDVCQRPDDVSTKRFHRGVLGPSVDPSADPASEDFRELSLFGSDCSTASLDVEDGSRFLSDDFVELFSFELLATGIAGIGLSVFAFSGTGGIGRVLGFSGTGGIGRVLGNSGTGGMGRVFFGFFGLAKITGFSGIGGIDGFALCFALGGNTVVLSSMSMELVATIFRITSGGGGAEGRGGGSVVLGLSDGAVH